MITIKDGNVDLKKLEVEDIIDIHVLQSFLDNFALGMNCAAVSVDRTGAEITKPSHYRDFCQKFIHGSSLGDDRCAECHRTMGQKAIEINKPYIGLCHAGLIDFAAPIIVNGEHLGTVLGGQILNAKPEKNKISKVASDLNINSEVLWDAAQSIDVVSPKNIEAAAEVLYIVVNTLAESGYSQLYIKHLSNSLVENFIEISKTIEMLAESAQDITAHQNELSTKITEVNTSINKVTEILSSITKVADRTKMIGLNASIEAARLGNSGRGFAIVAQEIQNLASISKKTSLQIADLNTIVSEGLNSTTADASQTLSITEDQSAAMEELAAAVANSVELAERLQTLLKNH